jgi:TRAP-type C4-dicarboxylate transport system permease small subunit
VNYRDCQAVAGRLLERIGRFERGLSFAAFLILIGVIFADVLSREVAGTGLHWARQAGVYANLFVVMLGLGLASAQGDHLRPRFADHWLPLRWEPFLNRTQDGIMALFCLGFAVVAINVVAESFAISERSTALPVPVWPIQAVIPAVFLIAAIRHAAFCLFPGLRPAATVDDGEAGG